MAKIARRKKVLWSLYSGTFFLSLHAYFLIYIQSSFISGFIDERYIVFIYALGALISVVVFLNVGKILSHISNRRLTLWLTISEFVLCLILAWSQSFILISIAFILQQALLPILFFTIDVFLEDYSKDRDTGTVRSLVFTASNIALVASPILVTEIGSANGFGSIFYLSTFFLVPFFIIIWFLQNKVKEPTYLKKPLANALKEFLFKKLRKDKNIRHIFMVNFLLQFFYAWMVIYSPLYLLHIGFTWDQIGIIFSIMLLPFLFFELPLGPLADNYLGEKEIIIMGFLILSASTIFLAFIHSTNLFVWAIALFLTRTGASFVEIMSEIYFFKQITGSRAYDIGLFRLTRPFSLVVAPIIASVSIIYFGERYSFIVLGVIMLYGLRFALPLVDTK